MPSKYRRLAVTLDPELTEGLEAAAPHLSSRSEAARLRELALIGSRALAVDGVAVRRQLDQLGASRESGDLVRLARELRRRRDSGADETASESLQWARGER